MTYSYSYRVGEVKLLGLARLLGIWRASVYKLVFRELLIFCVLYTATSCVYRLALRTPAQRKVFEKIVVYSGTFESILPLTFILGFYVTVVVQRWWAQYCYIPWPDRIMSYFAVLIPGADEDTVMLRRTAIRYLIQAEVLLLRTISSTVKKRFPTLRSLVDQGLMTENEFELYNHEKVPHISSKYWVPTQWCAMLFQRARRENRIGDYPLCVLLDELSRFKECLGTLFSYDWISIPLVYTQVATLAVYVFYFNTIMSRQYINFASVREEFGPEISAKYSIDLYVPIDTLMQLFFYLGWLKVAEQMINPFGEDDDDFECNWIVDRNLKVGLFAVDNMLNTLPALEKDRWWNKEDPQMSYTQASEKFAMTSGWFGSTANLEVPPQGHGSSHGHLPNIPEDASESNFTSTHTLHSRGGGDQEVSPRKRQRRLPPLRISIDRMDEVKAMLTSQKAKRRRSRTTAVESQPSSPDISRSMPDTHFCFANNIVNSGSRGRQQRSGCREESGSGGDCRLAQVAESSRGSLPVVGDDQLTGSRRGSLGNKDDQCGDNPDQLTVSGRWDAELTRAPLLPTSSALGTTSSSEGDGRQRRRCQRHRRSGDFEDDDIEVGEEKLEEENEDDEACRESSAGSAIVLVDGGDVSGVVADDNDQDCSRFSSGGGGGLVVDADSGFIGDAADAASAVATSAAVAAGAGSPVKAASTTGGEHLDSSAAGVLVGTDNAPATSTSSACHLYVDDWICEHKEEFGGDSIMKGTHSASACQLHNLHVGETASAPAIGGCRQSAGDLPAIVEMQGDPVAMEMMLEAAGGGGGGGGENVEKRVAFNPEIEKLEYDANFPVDQTLPAETPEPDQPHHLLYSQQQQQQHGQNQEDSDPEEESTNSTSYYE